MASTVRNESRHAVVILLDHPAFGRKRACATLASRGQDGSNVVAEVRRSYPESIMLQPGSEATDLDDAIAQCSQVPALVAAKVVSVRKQDNKTASQKGRP